MISTMALVHAKTLIARHPQECAMDSASEFPMTKA
jgi:hypothetical protein